jgi:hypothetical protein
MNKYITLFVVHMIFWLIVIVIVPFCDLSIKLSGKLFPLELVLSISFVPILVIVSWRAGREAPTQILRNYFLVFRWIGIGFLAYCIYSVCMI